MPSSCDVCLGGFDGSAEFYYERAKKARKQHKCYECAAEIQSGKTYYRVGGKCEGEMWEACVCVFCFEINTVFSCNNGVEWGNLWEQMNDYIFPDLTVSSPCFNKLTMEARAFLTEKWWAWKERQLA